MIDTQLNATDNLEKVLAPRYYKVSAKPTNNFSGL